MLLIGVAYPRTIRSSTCKPKVSSKSWPLCLRAICSSDRSSTLGTLMIEAIVLSLAGDFVNPLAPRFIQRVGDAQHGGHLGDGDALVAVEREVAFVRRLGRGPAVIAGDERREQQVLLAQAKQFAVADQIERVLVIAAVADEQPDLVQQRRDEQQNLQPRLAIDARP